MKAGDQVGPDSAFLLLESLLAELDKGGLVLRPSSLEAATDPCLQAVVLFGAMVEGSRDGLLILGKTGEVLYANRAVSQMFGFRKEDAIGHTGRDLQLEASVDWSIADEVISERVAVTGIQTLRDGQKHLVSGTPIFSDDRSVVYVVLSVQDITGMRHLITRLQESTELSELYRRELRKVEMRELQAGELVAESPIMQALKEQATRYAAVDSPVLILGETGTGKGVFAKLIHQASPRSDGPFLEVNCGAIPEGLIEAELFGYVKGAFTGADSKGKIGLVDLAHRGTLLLNEVGDLPLGMQVKLLRFLEDGEVWPVGGVKPKRPDVRIIAATNRDLSGMIDRGTFRSDLYYRLNVLLIRSPPLREHPEDSPWLVDMMLSQLERKLHRQRRVEPAALDLIMRNPFPGNVRELWNLIERLVVTTSVDAIRVEDLPAEVSRAISPSPAASEHGDDLRKALRRLEETLLKEALARYHSQTEAAKYLGVAQSTVARKMKQYRLTDRRAIP
jgi:PAS domain S-box-containing protein